MKIDTIWCEKLLALQLGVLWLKVCVRLSELKPGSARHNQASSSPYIGLQGAKCNDNEKCLEPQYTDSDPMPFCPYIWDKKILDSQHWIHRFVLLGRRKLDGVQVPTVPGGLGSGLSAQHQPFLLLEIRLAQHLTQLRNSSSLLRL